MSGLVGFHEGREKTR